MALIIAVDAEGVATVREFDDLVHEDWEKVSEGSLLVMRWHEETKAYQIAEASEVEIEGDDEEAEIDTEYLFEQWNPIEKK